MQYLEVKGNWILNHTVGFFVFVFLVAIMTSVLYIILTKEINNLTQNNDLKNVLLLLKNKSLNVHP